MFFWRPPDRVITGTVNDIQFHDRRFQQLWCPSGAPLWWYGAGQGDQFSLGGAIKNAPSGRSGRVLAGENGLKPFFHQLLTGSADRRIQGRGDLAVAPPSAALRGSAFNRIRAFINRRAGCLPI